jgi:tetratricopeptide (TPR) repeat protein
MKNAYILIGFAASGLLFSSCTSYSNSVGQNRRMLQTPAASDQHGNDAADAAIQGETAGAYGDNETAVKLFERSVAQHPTVSSQFNLATAYERTGRPKEAAALYRVIVQSRNKQRGTTESSIRKNGPETTFDYREEAARRLAVLDANEKPGDRDARVMTNAGAARADAAAQPPK